MVELVEWAQAIGAPPLSPHTAERMTWRLGGEEKARLRLADCAVVARALREEGTEPTMLLCSRKLQAARWNSLAAARRVRQHGRRRRLIGRPDCSIVGRRPTARRARANALAGCACRSCVELLSEELRAYASKVAVETRMHLSVHEAKGDILAVLLDALVTWPGEGEFPAWLSGCLRMHFLTRWRDEVKLAPPTVALDEERVAG